MGGSSPAYGWTESALSQGRKISLSGMPMPDVAQHQGRESDYSSESTHVDALTLNLVHDTTDIHIPVGTDQFALEVRRTLTQEIWRETISLPLEKYADKPFGPCWKSSICPSVHLIKASYNTKYSVTDHMGRTYSFEKCPTGFNNDQEPLGYEQYKDLSTTQSALSMQGVTFEYRELNGELNQATLTLPNGTVLDYTFVLSTETLVRTTYHSFFRLDRVTDRYGNTLTYGYTNHDTIPSTITSSATGQQLVITVEDLTPLAATRTYRVVEIEDGEQNTIIYSYENGRLDKVMRPENSTTIYTYDDWSETDSDTSDPYTQDYQHLTIKSIKDANGNAYEFTFIDPERYYSRPSFSRMPKCGNPRILNTIDFPDDASSVSFAEYKDTGENESGIYNAYMNINDTWQYKLLGTRKNFITDVNLHEWTYYFSDPVGCDPGDYRREIWTFEYGQLTITAPNNSGTEEYNYGRLPGMDSPGDTDGLKLMALDSSVSFSGATTEYTYGYFDAENALESCAKPSSEINAMEKNKSYTYTDGYNFQLKKVVDELGRETVYEFGFIGENNDVSNVGKRTRMTVLEPVDGLILTETEFRYDNPDYKNFMTGKIVKKRAGTGWVAQDEPEPASWVADLVTEYERHARGKVAKQIIYPNGITSAGLTTIYDYDLNNNLTSVIDPRGNETVNEYDDLNRLKIISLYEGSAESGTLRCDKKFWYDLRSNKRWEKDEEDHYTYFGYDEFNNLVKTVRVMSETFAETTIATMAADNYDTDYSHDPVDIIATSEYNEDGTLHATVDPRGMRTEYQYDALRRLTDMNVDVSYAGRPLADIALEYNTHYDYTGDNCSAITLPPYKFSPTKVTDPRGYATETDYDALNRSVETRSQIESSGSLEKLTTMGYDKVGNLTSVTNWVDRTEFQETKTFYDALNRPEKVISNPNSTDNQEVRMYYTSTGLQWKTIIENGEDDRESTVQYDAAGRPTVTTSPGVVLVEGGPTEYATTETEYDANGNVQFVTDSEDNTTEYTYDYRNRLLDTIAPEVTDWGQGGNGAMAHPTVHMECDAVGNATAITDAEGKRTDNTYDAANRLTETLAPTVDVYENADDTSATSLRPKTVNEYDKGGNIRYATDANNNQLAPADQKKVEMQYDALGRLVMTIDALSNAIKFEYDENGNQTFLIDGNDNSTEFVYDGLNRKTSTIYPVVGSAAATHEDAEYDFVGNRIKRIDCNGAETIYDYDLLNRLDEVTYLDDDATASDRRRDYEYDNLGNLEFVYEYPVGEASSDAAAEVSYTYDTLNRVVSETSVGLTHIYKYDLNGNRRWAKYDVTDREVDWSYDALNRITEITEEDPAVTPQTLRITIYRYDLNSKPVYREYPTGVMEERTFDAMGRLLTMTTSEGTDEMLIATYHYDAVGSALWMGQTAPGETIGGESIGDHETKWEYDDRYRLTEETIIPPASANTTRTVYTWDDADNRSTKTVYDVNDQQISAMSYNLPNALNQMTGWADDTTQVVYQYDDNGNRTIKTMTEIATGIDSIASYAYDEDNRLVLAGALNQVVNGDFEEGNSAFISGYAYSSSQNSSGYYYVGDSSTAWHGGLYALADHTTGSGNMWIGNGDTQPNTLWEQSVGVVAGKTYSFSTWSAILYTDNAQLGFYVDDEWVGTLDVEQGGWTQFSGDWTATSSEIVVLSIRNISSGYLEGYAIDDIVFAEKQAVGAHQFKYDYRSRRYYRSTPTENNVSVYDGGLAVQEYNTTTGLTTEFIRGEGMGGGVGGMVYSIKDDGSGNDDIICSHANHRGDIIARSDSTGSLTSFALYEAYGARPYEWGSDPDRQKANTKEEESDLQLLNEGMRFRDLETGTFLTRDPIGYVDGPNIYCYVHCNPITHFDAFGLFDDDKERSLYLAGKAQVAKSGFFNTDLGKEVEASLNSRYHTENDKKTDVDGNDDENGEYRNTIRFGETKNGRPGEYDPVTKTITLNKANFKSISDSAAGKNTAPSTGSKSISGFGGTIAHEGMHAFQHDSRGGVPGKGMPTDTTLGFEKEAWLVGRYVTGRGGTESAMLKGFSIMNYPSGGTFTATEGMDAFRLSLATSWAAPKLKTLNSSIDVQSGLISGPRSKLPGSQARADAVVEKARLVKERDKVVQKWYSE